MKRGRDGIKHEPVDLALASRLRWVFRPADDAHSIEQMHRRDEDTKWFGVRHDHEGQLVLEDFGRYTSVVSAQPTADTGAPGQHPQLVSFIGSTSAGKSSLIRALIARAGPNDSENTPDFPSPVVGSPLHDSVPTSGDVHLYGDPSTLTERYPLLYADCEGFEGGQRLPARPKICRGRFSWEPADESGVTNIRQRPLRWACTERMSRREFAVSNLYPRILYAFSDCIVFVLKNPKTFQSVALTKLLDWAAVAMERSVNRATRPHCVVVLNASDVGVRNEEWDMEWATKNLLAGVQDALDPERGVPRFRMLADRWRHLGKRIDTAEDLIMCFYSSFRVIRIPSTPHYRAIDGQLRKLDNAIRETCRLSTDAKRRARMSLTAEEQQVYLSQCFDHYATRLDTAFDFTQVALRDRPIAQGFDRHALEFVITLSKRASSVGSNDIRSIFRSINALFASYILVDCVRFRKGSTETWCWHYTLALRRVLDEYRRFHHPCSYRSSDGTRSCLLVRACHGDNCHQDGTGVIADGEYLDEIDDIFSNEWIDGIRATVSAMSQTLLWRCEQLDHSDAAEVDSEVSIVMDMHLTQLDRVFRMFGPPGDIRSIASCFACLAQEAEHALPCGHTLCNGCTRAYGVTHEYTVSLQYCPMHPKDRRRDALAVITYRPPGAGIRVLSLDGGGIRGIVQLEVLRAIERALGDLIPVQKFFDLILGTGTGGLNAVSLSLSDTTIGRCMETLYTVCENAYPPRQGSSSLLGPVARSLGVLGSHKTDRLDAALRAMFTRDARLFGSPEQFARSARVAVMASGIGRDRPLLLTNYRRPGASGRAYVFDGGHDQLTTWESVRATLTKRSNLRTLATGVSAFLDASTAPVNPSAIAHAEAKLLHADQDAPDLILSLGTGQDRQKVLRKLTQRRHNGDAGEKSNGSRVMKQRRRFSRSDIEAEAVWHSLRAMIPHDQHSRLIRVNPDMSHSVPNTHDKAAMQDLQSRTRQRLGETHRLAVIQTIARRLLATAFFVETRPQSREDQLLRLHMCRIACRFPNGSDELRAVGKLLQGRQVHGFSPYFIVRSEATPSPGAQEITVTSIKAAQISNDALFPGFNFNIRHADMHSPLSILLVLSEHDALQPEGYPISGFPRTITTAWLNACVQPEVRENHNAEHSRPGVHAHPRRTSEIAAVRGSKNGQVDCKATDSCLSPTSSIDDPFHLCDSRQSATNTAMCDDYSSRSSRSSIASITAVMRSSTASTMHCHRHLSDFAKHASYPADWSSGATSVRGASEPFALDVATQSAGPPPVLIDSMYRPRHNLTDEASPNDDGAWLRSELFRSKVKQGDDLPDCSKVTREARRNSEDSIISYFVGLLSNRGRV